MNVIKLVEVINTIKKLTLVFEYCPKDLKRIIDETNSGKGLDKNMIKVNFLFFILFRVIFIKLSRVLDIFISIKFYTEI